MFYANYNNYFIFYMYFNFIITILCVTKTTTFSVPDVNLEAYESHGLKISIPAITGIKLFAFHANINREILHIEPGEINVELKSPQHNNNHNVLSHVANVTLNVGDTVNYWVFVQHEQLGYNKGGLTWTVEELLPPTDLTTCAVASQTIVAGKTVVCAGSTIFQDTFNNTSTISKSKWQIEHFIPFDSPDFEFVSYQNNPQVCYVRDNILYIKPKLRGTADDAVDVDDNVAELDLRDGCTRNTEDQCLFPRGYSLTVFRPPITSGRIVSKLKFRYGEIEIKAKLPAGDWIYPQVYLQHVSKPTSKLWIAYARGNKELLSNNDNSDIGSRLLFGGPVVDSHEPNRSRYLSSKSSGTPFVDDPHVYKVIWKQDSISLFIDNEKFGEVPPNILSNIDFMQRGNNDNDNFLQLVLGVGVGGINDFPDDFRSGSVSGEKPWRNKDRKQISTFLAARNRWLSTWNGNKSALQVYYVKIKAL